MICVVDLHNFRVHTLTNILNLVYNLCHTYVRATMGVSYANRLCERARCYLREFFAPPPSKREKMEHKRQEKEDK